MRIVSILTALFFIGWSAPLADLFFDGFYKHLDIHKTTIAFWGIVLYGGLILEFFRQIFITPSWKRLGNYFILTLAVKGILYVISLF